MTLRVISYGGGIQSTALIVLATQGKINYPSAVFANVGNDSEKPATLAYLQEIIPWAAAHGVEITEVRRLKRDGTPFATLLDYHKANVERTGATPLPVKMLGAGPGGIANRTCSRDWKGKVVARWVKAQGATPTDPAQLAIGFSTDEIWRASNKNDTPFETRTFPLLELGLSRNDCEELIRSAGLPVPPKSACWFCPYHPPRKWAEIRRDDPALFEAVASLEDHMNEARVRHGKPAFWWTSHETPMREWIRAAQDTLPGLEAHTEECDEGSCFT